MLTMFHKAKNTPASNNTKEEESQENSNKTKEEEQRCQQSRTDSSSGSSDKENAESPEEDKNVKKAPVCPFNEKYSSREFVYVVCAGLALAFNSGYINGACLSGLLVDRRQAVSAFTGAYTVSALSLADGNIDFFGFQASMILSFMAGATITGLMTPRTKAWRIAPTYGPTFLVGGAFLLVAALLPVLDPDNDKRLFYFAAAANGVQNGISSMYSGNLIRSCHFTGTSTDIGLLVGQCLRGNRTQVWKLCILVGLALAFWCGGVVSFFATTHFTNESLLFNAGLFFLIGVSLVMFLVKQLGISIQQATLGTWSWQEALEKLHLRTADGEPVSPEAMMDVFDKIDSDRNGVIEEEELYVALQEAGLCRLSRKRVRAMMSVADENADGLLSRDEWKDLVLGKTSQVKKVSNR